MRRRVLVSMLLALSIGITVSAHDLFMKLDSYFLTPNSRATVRLMNGTFQKSEGVVSADRFRDVTLFAPGFSSPVSESIAWRNDEKTTIMDIQTRGPGTYLVAVSTKPREISLKAADFNNYLKEDGLPDILAARKKNNELGKDVRERYSKHVRAVFQVGDTLSDDYKRRLDYPVEIIPQQNPYALKVGQRLAVLCLLEGRPLVNQFVIAGWESSDGKLHSLSTRTDAKGLAHFKLSGAGKWFVKMIHMEPMHGPEFDYESKWATLTFEMR